MRRFAVFGSLLLLLSAGDAWAGQIAIGEARVAFTPPTGHCELDRKEARDAGFVDAVADAMGDVRILAAFAACDQLAIWRKGLLTYLRDYGFLTVARADEGRTITDGRPAIMRALATALRAAAPAASHADDGGRIDHLGVLDADERAVYYGLVAEVETPDGRLRDALEVSATTLIRGKLVSYVLYGEFAGRGSIDAMLRRQRADLDRLIAAN
ncbi:MAG TPA: hypothetical protein VHM01_18275 [Alphaproteobacteria bacterium]|nr:hypothetical protein [Alphaproteobacteria bacterium]